MIKKLFFFIYLLSYVYLVITYQFSIYEILIALINLIMLFVYLNSIKRIRDGLFFLFLLSYLYCSIFIVAILELNGVGFYKNNISYYEYRSLVVWGNHLYFISFLAYFLLATIASKRRRFVLIKHSSSIQLDTSVLFKKITVFVYILCLLSMAFGLYDSMEAPKVVLPFHLNGLIGEIHSVLYPFLFSIYLYDCYEKNRKIDKVCIIMFVLFSVLEVMVTMSKGNLLAVWIPAALMLFICGRFTKEMFTRFFFPLVIVTYLLYPIINTARNEGELSFQTLSDAYLNNKQNSLEEQSSPFVRAFLTGIYYVKVMSEVDENPLSFDFKNVPYLVLNGGGSTYMTRIIDQVPDNVHHSSGITGLPDAILWGGNLMCYMVLIIFVVIAMIGDNSIKLRMFSPYKLILFLFYYMLVINRSISFFFDSLFFASVISILLKIVIAKYYRRRYA